MGGHSGALFIRAKQGRTSKRILVQALKQETTSKTTAAKRAVVGCLPSKYCQNKEEHTKKMLGILLNGRKQLALYSNGHKVTHIHSGEC
jgi:hypothetical protein